MPKKDNALQTARKIADQRCANQIDVVLSNTKQEAVIIDPLKNTKTSQRLIKSLIKNNPIVGEGVYTKKDYVIGRKRIGRLTSYIQKRLRTSRKVKPGTYQHEVIGKKLASGTHASVCQRIILDQNFAHVLNDKKIIRLSKDKVNAPNYNSAFPDLKLKSPIFFEEGATKYQMVTGKRFQADLFQFLVKLRADKVGMEFIDYLRIAGGLCYAVANMHEQNLLHGDLKSANILIEILNGRIENVAISDLDTVTPPPVKDHKITTTFEYAAPELLSSYPRLVRNTFLTDIYSLGRIISELFHAVSLSAYTRNIVHDERKRVDICYSYTHNNPFINNLFANMNVPTELIISITEALSNALHPNPAYRTSSARELGEFFTNLITQLENRNVCKLD